MGISEIDTNRLSIIVSNNTKSKILNFKLNLINCENETIREILITDCLPNILRWELIEKPIDYVNKYNYSVSLTENNEIFYKGQFNY